MHIKTLIVLLLFTVTLWAEFETKISNTNITVSSGSAVPSQAKNYLYNYDRLRLNSEYTNGDYFTTMIADGVHYLGDDYIHSPSFNFIKLWDADTPLSTKSSFSSYNQGSSYAKLYRLYTGFEDSKNKVILGLQKIGMGVGRIWTPTNLFNPRNSFALEPDEIFGVLALKYTRHLDETSELMVVSSQRKDKTFKYATRLKKVFNTTEVALDIISSDKIKMLGLEIEGDLYDTGIEVRFEGVYLESLLLNHLYTEEKRYLTQSILGADYGFLNGITLVLEAYYSSQSFTYNELVLNKDSEILSSLVLSKFYMGTGVSYAFNLVLDGSISYIESFNKQNSRFVSAVLNYTLNDFNSFSLGALITDGASQSEYGQLSNTYYFKYALSF